MNPVAPDAVLFDMDGTLVDSEKVWDVGLDELATHYGGVLSPAARARMVGTSMALSMTILHEDLGRPELSVDASVAWLHDRVSELFAAGLIWKPGARELLAALRAGGVPTALVTATERQLVDIALKTIGVDNFDAVVCGDEVARTKPDPLPYATAAAALGVSPARCVAIEDSPTGIASALAAGCAVIGVPSEVPLSGIAGITLIESLVAVDPPYLASLLPTAR